MVQPSSHSPYSQRLSLISHPQACPVLFLITDCPDQDALENDYLPTLRAHDCVNLVRLCDPNAYDPAVLKGNGVAVWDWFFEDGSIPPDTIITSFRNLVDSLISNPSSSSHPALALHCVSGVGRAPVLVTCALIDGGMDPIEAVELVRSKRRGCLNKKQLAWLLDSKKGFKPLKRGKRKPVASSGPANGGKVTNMGSSGATLDADASKKKMFGGLFGRKK
ncbi:protein-tyrosine phosphatase-like protein [Fimicolochytrium jonesii]|uniref:protein-tyrosine phosphatase-like protein n=1 Tax=Fimicolochytrium jonesii TaxID=1396493 RepID=UPI0022FF3512|nr:protein-tyrosine phosphatase-like protein [Fimicolochytrium jonesii]KAI8826661.1 protein-tyrosine phosphatase-like protein [Fimicolochytrium jonesii]